MWEQKVSEICLQASSVDFSLSEHTTEVFMFPVSEMNSIYSYLPRELASSLKLSPEVRKVLPSGSFGCPVSEGWADWTAKKVSYLKETQRVCACVCCVLNTP